MTTESVLQLVGLVIFALAIVLPFLGRPTRRAWDSLTRPRAAPVLGDLDAALGDGLRRPLPKGWIARDEARFRTVAGAWLEPVLDEAVRTAQGQGHHAAYDTGVDAGRAFYRLEVQRKDHPLGQPLPWLRLSCGETGEVALLRGGWFPRPQDAYLPDPLAGADEVAWDAVADEVARFMDRVFVPMRRARPFADTGLREQFLSGTL